jgi:phage antirepressor YoqD-like protein
MKSSARTIKHIFRFVKYLSTFFYTYLPVNIHFQLMSTAQLQSRGRFTLKSTAQLQSRGRFSLKSTTQLQSRGRFTLNSTTQLQSRGRFTLKSTAHPQSRGRFTLKSTAQLQSRGRFTHHTPRNEVVGGILVSPCPSVDKSYVVRSLEFCFLESFKILVKILFSVISSPVTLERQK